MAAAMPREKRSLMRAAANLGQSAEMRGGFNGSMQHMR